MTTNKGWKNKDYYATEYRRGEQGKPSAPAERRLLARERGTSVRRAAE